MTLHDIWKLDAALGKKNFSQLTQAPYWNQLCRWAQYPDDLPVEQFPALGMVSDVRSKVMDQRVSAVLGAPEEGKTAVVRLLAYEQTNNDREVWYLDLASIGTQEIGNIINVIRHRDRPTCTFIVDHCHADPEVSQPILALPSQMQHARFIFVANYCKDEEEPEGLFSCMNPEQIVWISEVPACVPESSIRHISVKSLEEYEKEGKADLEELLRRRDVLGVDHRDYIEFCNEKSLIGHLPQWQHLYMGAYGIFPRPAKEAQLLGALNESIKKFDQKDRGMLLHVISGASGSGKSALARLVMRRLCKQEDIGQFDSLAGASSRIHILEISKIDDWELLPTRLKTSFKHSVDKPIYIVFFDDLFAKLEQNEITNLFGILIKIAEYARILFLVTSPSWLISKSESQQYRKDFRLVDSIETIIGGLDMEDRESLKAQYLEIYPGKNRHELMTIIEEEKDLILIKLALHQNLHYSEYLKSTFQVLLRKQGWEKYLAALLLSSTLSRFYVHCPLPLIKQLNKRFGLDKPQQRLPEDASEYESLRLNGFNLFQVRCGTRSPLKSSGLPDTVAPFHDRVAQVIYETWGDNVVPLLGVGLRALNNIVYEELNELPESQPILANVFRGMLHREKGEEGEARELNYFINNFGPVQNGQWVHLRNPVASNRWVTHARYRPKLTSEFLLSWAEAIKRTNTHDDIETANSHLLSIILNPRNPGYAADIAWMGILPELGEEHFFLLRSVLEELLRSQPLPTDLLAKYLPHLNDWLKNHSKTGKPHISYRYLVMCSLANAYFGGLHTQTTLNKAAKKIASDYLLDLNTEYKTYTLLSSKLFSDIRWEVEESKRLVSILLPYVENEQNWHRPVLFEHLLKFIRYGQLVEPSGTKLFHILYDISIQMPEATSLTFSWQALFEHLKCINSVRHDEYRDTLKGMKDKLLSEETQEFFITAGYPDFAHRFLEHIIHVEKDFSAAELARLLRPLLQLPEEHSATKRVFQAAGKIKWIDLKKFCKSVNNDLERQIRLCMAAPADLSLEFVLKEFTELLLRQKVTIPTTLCFFLKEYLSTRKKEDIPKTFLENYQKQIYGWLHNQKNQREDIQRRAVPVFLLACSNILFSEEHLKGLEELARIAIQKGHIFRITPFKYLNWWLKEEVHKTSEQKRCLMLDAFWEYALENSNLVDKNKRFIMHDKYFLFLLNSYGIERNEGWWGRAIQRLTKFYVYLWSSSSHNRTHWVRRKGREVDKKTMDYKRRLCLDETMKAVFMKFSTLRNELQGGFESAVKEALEPYKAQSWAASWLSSFQPTRETDHTRLLLEYLDSVEHHPPSYLVFNVRDHIEQWNRTINATQCATGNELQKVWEWLTQTPIPRISVHVMLCLLDFSPGQMESFQCGSLVIRILNDSRPDLNSKSMLVRSYTKWLESQPAASVNDLESILKWLLAEISRTEDSQVIMYGFQDLFETASNYNIEFDLQKADNVFFRALQVCLDIKGGGALARDYFGWLSSRREHFRIYHYLEFIKGELRREQTPYALSWLLKCLSESVSFRKYDTEELEKSWQILKEMVKYHLDSPGTTMSLAKFCLYLGCLSTEKSINTEKLNEISEELYDLCLSLKDHPRIVYLMLNTPVFQPILTALVDRPSPEEILRLWEAIPGTLRIVKPDDSFVCLTGKVDAQLGKDKKLRQQFRRGLLENARGNPGNRLSSKFVNLIIDDTDYLKENLSCMCEVSKLLPALIECQNDLEEVAWIIKRCTNPKHDRLLLIMSEEEKVKYEFDLMNSIKENAHKAYADVCVFWLIKNCTQRVHHEKLSEIVGSYLSKAKSFGGTKVKGNIWVTHQIILQHFWAYIENEIEGRDDLHSNAVRFLLEGITSNAKSAGVIGCFLAVLDVWKESDIAQDMAISTLRALILGCRMNDSKDILNSCKVLADRFGQDAPLSTNLSIGGALEELTTSCDMGLNSIQQRLYADFESSES